MVLPSGCIVAPYIHNEAFPELRDSLGFLDVASWPSG